MFNRNQQPLSNEQLYKIAPSIFAEEKHSSRSKRYAYYSTREVLEALKAEGFYPYSATQSGSRVPGKKDFTKHIIKFRHATQKDITLSVGDEIQEICFTNSHDGTSKAVFQNGIYRLICSNGMMTGQSVETVNIPHRALTTDNVIEGAYTVLKQQELVQSLMEDMKSIRLVPSEQQLLAHTSGALRWDSEDWRPSVKEILTVRRSADKEPTLWNTFNTIQENIIKGGIRKDVNIPKEHIYGKNNTRAVTGINDLTKLNSSLFDLADGMRRIKMGLPAFDEVSIDDFL